jgi:hypothetical protein
VSFPIELAMDFSSQGASPIGPTNPLNTDNELSFPSESGLEIGGGANVVTVSYVW